MIIFFPLALTPWRFPEPFHIPKIWAFYDFTLRLLLTTAAGTFYVSAMLIYIALFLIIKTSRNGDKAVNFVRNNPVLCYILPAAVGTAAVASSKLVSDSVQFMIVMSP